MLFSHFNIFSETGFSFRNGTEKKVDPIMTCLLLLLFLLDHISGIIARMCSYIQQIFFFIIYIWAKIYDAQIAVLIINKNRDYVFVLFYVSNMDGYICNLLSC